MNDIKTFGSVCSGIEAASFVLEPLNIQPLWLSEIDDFPSRFLAQRYAHSPNLGDMNDIPQKSGMAWLKLPIYFAEAHPVKHFLLLGGKMA